MTRAHEIQPMQAGWEYVEGSTMLADARRIGEESVQMEYLDGRGRQTIRLSGS